MDDEDVLGANKCPVCGSDPRTHPGLRFKINTKCYHRICEGCVDRHFSAGKAECPVGGCHKSMWKKDWRTQTFEDLKVEREVEIRRKVFRTLERREDEFESKRAWDDFLELREELVMNLVFNTDAAATNRKLREYAVANGLKDATAEGNDAAAGKPARRKDTDEADPSGLIKGLKKLVLPKARELYDPFMGMARTRDYYEVKDDYVARVKQGKPNDAMSAGGYSFAEYMDECLLRAFAGFGVFVEEEMGLKDKAQTSQAPAARMKSVTTVDDPF